jgi:biopolymer transport protein TolQ
MKYVLLTQLLNAQIGHEVEMGVFTMILRAGFLVQLVLLSLLLMSVMTWAIIFYKWRMFKQAESENRRFHNLFLHQQKLSTIHDGAEEMQFSPVAGIFRAGYIELVRISRIKEQQQVQPVAADPGGISTQVYGVDNVSRALKKATESELGRMERALPFLATTGSTAPFIGLFGTVWGIMNAFRSIGIAGSASLVSVAPGISEALVATAAGLAAAIPAVVGYNYFIQRIRVMDNDMRTFSAEFLNIIERHFRSI